MIPNRFGARPNVVNNNLNNRNNQRNANINNRFGFQPNNQTNNQPVINNAQNINNMTDQQLRDLVRLQRDQEFLTFSNNPSQTSLQNYFNARNNHWNNPNDPVNKLSVTDQQAARQRDDESRGNAVRMVSTAMHMQRTAPTQTSPKPWF